MKEARHKRHIWNDLICIKFPEEAKSVQMKPEVGGWKKTILLWWKN